LANPVTSDYNQRAKEISESFENSVISFPFPGWTLSLTGVEKFEMFSGFASSITIENGYTSEYKKSLKFTGGPEGEIIDQQGITSGFSPLLGINVTFKPISEGNLTASFKLNKTTNYDLIPSTPVLNITNTSDISINATYTKQGFKIPLFGLSLDNDLSISFSYTRTTNDPRTVKFDAYNLIWSDDALNGSISTSLNPAIIYALSKSVSIQLFYKYTKVQPTEGSIAIPTRTSNEAGLNIKLTIQ
jgi:cell surface protein SprA